MPCPVSVKERLSSLMSALSLPFPKKLAPCFGASLHSGNGGQPEARNHLFDSNRQIFLLLRRDSNMSKKRLIMPPNQKHCIHGQILGELIVGSLHISHVIHCDSRNCTWKTYCFCVMGRVGHYIETSKFWANECRCHYIKLK